MSVDNSDQGFTPEAAQAELLQGLFRHSPMVIGVKDLDGRYLLANDEYQRVFGFPLTAIIGRTDNEIFPPDTAGQLRRHDVDVLRTEQTVTVEESIVVQGEHRSYLAVRFPLRDANGRVKALGLMATDITRRADSPPLGNQASANATGNLVQLVWKPSFECGHALLDLQHRQLFDQSNLLLDAVIAGKDEATLRGMMQQLVAQIESHFQDEDAIMVQIDYPRLDRHRVEHAEFAARARTVLYSIGQDPSFLTELFRFLVYEVIAQHMLADDRDYYPYLRKHLGQPGISTGAG